MDWKLALDKYSKFNKIIQITQISNIVTDVLWAQAFAYFCLIQA